MSIENRVNYIHMNLEDKVADTNLKQDLLKVKDFCREVWSDAKPLFWYTGHDCSHSEEIINLLNQIIDRESLLRNEQEAYILLASAYLHDIGMQDAKYKDIPVSVHTEIEHEEIRKRHAEASYEIIRSICADAIKRDGFHPPRIDEQYVPIIAHVSKGHSGSFFDEVVSEFENNPATPDSRKVRGELLTALLMIADELDLQCKRVKYDELAKYDISPYTKVHWFKHHYVEYVAVENSIIQINLKFPQDATDYKDMIKELIETKLIEQIGRVNEVFKRMNFPVISDEIQFRILNDSANTKRKLPSEALLELKKMLGKDAPPAIESKSASTVTPNLIPQPSKIFTGRKEKLDEFKTTFDSNRIILIEGVGGIGKTEFAAMCIEKHLQGKNVVWFDGLSDSKMDALMSGAGFEDLIKGEKSDLAKYSGFVSLIERHEKIIFIDNFQDIPYESFKDFLKFASRKLKNSHIILLSKENIADVQIARLLLEGLKEDSATYARRVIETYYKGVVIREDDLNNMCNKLDGHPLAIELAVQLLSYGENADNIIETIVELEGSKSKEFTKRLLDMVLDHPNTTTSEKEFMLKMSVFRGVFDYDASVYVLGKSDKSALYSLIDKLMISPVEGGYRMHPLVRAICYKRLTDNKEVHAKAKDYLKTLRTDKTDIALETEIFHHLSCAEMFDELADCVAQKGRDLIITGDVNFLKATIGTLIDKGLSRPEFNLFYGDIAQIKGEWNDALAHFEKAFSAEDSDERLKAEAYIKYGEMLYRKGDIKGSHEFFKDAYKLCKDIHRKEEARSLNDIGLVEQMFGNLNTALKKLEDAYEIRNLIDDKEGIAISLNNIGLIYRKQGKYKEALDEYQKALKIFKEIGDKSRIAVSINNIGVVCKLKGKHKEALEQYQESLKITEEIGDRSLIATSLNNIGLVYDAQGKYKEALEQYQESLKIREEVGDKEGIARSYHNFGTFYIENNDYMIALEYLFKSCALQRQMEINTKETISFISRIRKELGLTKFKEMAEEVFDKLPDDLKPFVDINEFTTDATIHKIVKVGRNAPCPCGSGKKFKKCCGA